VWAIGFRQAMRSSDNGEDAELSAKIADPPQFGFMQAPVKRQLVGGTCHLHLMTRTPDIGFCFQARQRRGLHCMHMVAAMTRMRDLADPLGRSLSKLSAWKADETATPINLRAFKLSKDLGERPFAHLAD
jgi:hypothetical protein